MKPSRGTTPARSRAPPTPGIYAATPNRLTRQRSTESKNSSTSEDEYDGVKNAKRCSDEVAVYCRLRPLGESEEVPRCVEAVDNNTVHLNPPETSRAYISGRQSTATAYSFKEVFDGDATQKNVFDRVALRLVKDLLQGKNGLLFTYGVTGSGKTHTMTGNAQDPGVMMRSIDVIFNSIADHLVSRKNMIVPDRLNDFQVQSIADAALTEQNDMISGRQRARGAQNGRFGGYADNDHGNLSNRRPDTTKLLDEIDQNRSYAVFISYCEIYNTYIYDLLEDTRDTVTGRPKYETKSLREDAYGNMYVHGSSEIEVRSSSEAIDAFNRGQKRRRVAATQLNQESSRSHTIFNIRLVKAYPSGEGEIDLEKPCMLSQLALVDLAGAERAQRTGNAGQALKEAGRINNSLMNLRRCMERLRENQKTRKGHNGINSTGGNVPYRDDKLTHLFRNYFEGTGSVKMIVCINPQKQDFDENVHVMQFAEMAAEVHIERIDPLPRELALTAGQRRANELMKEALRKNSAVSSTTDAYAGDPIYSLGPPWPANILADADSDDVVDILIPFIERRIETRNILTQDYRTKQEEFRARLVTMEQELVLLREENVKLKSSGEGDKRRIRDLEGRLVNAEAANSSLQRKCYAFNDVKANLENELDQKELELNHQKKEQKRTHKKFISQISQERNANTELSERLKEQEEERIRIEKAREKLRQVSHIVNGPDREARSRTRANTRKQNADTTTSSETDVQTLAPRRSSLAARRKAHPQNKSDPNISALQSTIEDPLSDRKNIAVANLRHRRSRSAGVTWVDHRPGPNEPQLVTKSTIMQPSNQGREVKTIRGCPSDKDLKSPKVSRYSLTTQSQDKEGELETKIYKGDIIPTSTGGRQIVFDDVEVLKQRSPSPKRRSKRSFEEIQNIENTGRGGVGRRIAALEAAGAAFRTGADNIESAYQSSKKFRV